MSFVLFETRKRCRNAHFSINSGATFSHITHFISTRITTITKIYINNMAKRQANGATNSIDKKFEIYTDAFVVVTNFNGRLLVYTRKYNGNFPIKEGVCMFTN